MAGFQDVEFHRAAGKPIDVARARFRGGAGPPDEEESFNSDETAARYYLSQVLGQDDRPAVRGVTAPENPALVPDLKLQNTQAVPKTGTTILRFGQARNKIPIFGSLAVVEIDANRELVSVNANIADIEDVSAVASLSPEQAIEALAKHTDTEVSKFSAVDPPELNFYLDRPSEHWHLCYYFQKVPFAPAGFIENANQREGEGHGTTRSPRTTRPLMEYLVDAHNGSVLLEYPANPMLDMPSKCNGIDDLGSKQEFFGRQVPPNYEMYDPLHGLKTYDLNFSDIDTAPSPANPVVSGTASWAPANGPAVSAHVNAGRVYNFYNSVLSRKSVDDLGMDLVSAVNCIWGQSGEPSPQWHNAAWTGDRMVYGQDDDAGNGKLRSWARFLDVIAHELTHGVTQFSSNLVYKDQSGALNESFSDIFGVIIANWTLVDKTDISNWDWQIGRTLGRGGGPLRDFQKPSNAAGPEHMNDYSSTFIDNGGVHTNSNIHNFAAYKVLSSVGSNGEPAFMPEEVALLYYLALTRLDRLAQFSDVLRRLIQVAETVYGGNAAEMQEKVALIEKAYDDVGIV